MHVTSAEASAIAARVADIEQRTGVEVVVALVARTDPYPEARWKAFALASALAALAVVLHDLLRAPWPGGVLVPVVAILAAGLANGLAAHYFPRYGRVYVRDNRAEAEARQYAESTFLTRGLFATANRCGVLLLIALYERAVVVHGDSGFAGRIGEADWQHVVDPIVRGVRAGERVEAVQAGLNALESLLADRGFATRGTAANVLSDRPLEERGS